MVNNIDLKISKMGNNMLFNKIYGANKNFNFINNFFYIHNFSFFIYTEIYEISFNKLSP